MKSIFVAAIGTLLAVFSFKECKSAPGNDKASPSNPATLDDHDVDITLYAGKEKIRFLVTLLDLDGKPETSVMCNGALVGQRDILTVSKCAHEIAISGDLDRYRVQVAEGLDALYASRLKHILCVDYDVNYADRTANQLAWIVLTESAAVQVIGKTLVTNIKSKDHFTIQTLIDEDETYRERLRTASYPLYHEEFTEGGTLGLDKVTRQIIKDVHQGIICGGELFFYVPSKFTAEQIQENPKRIMGFLLFHRGIFQGLGLSSTVNNDGSRVDVYARVNKQLTDMIPKTNRQSLQEYEIPN